MVFQFSLVHWVMILINVI